MKRRLALLLQFFILCIGIQAMAQARLVAVTYDHVLTPYEQFDKCFENYPYAGNPADYKSVIKFVGGISRDAHFICLNYRTEDPSGKEVIASGLVALPVGRMKGVVSVSPMCREKKMAATVNRWDIECLASMLGYAVLIPDNIGYGATQDEAPALLMSDNSALVAVHFREAVQEYLASLEKPLKLPAKTIFFGYSLGTAGALATACYYHAHPELKVKLKALYLGDGPYDPSVALEAALALGVCDYMLYPAIARGMNRWMGMNLDYNQLFTGKVLEDFDEVSNCVNDMTELATTYGQDLHTYLHPDWFTPERNPEIKRLFDGFKSMKISVDRHSLPRGLKIYLRHSAEDRYVPVACTDTFREELRQAGYYNVTYFRDKHGNHYQEGGRSLIDILLLALNN